MYPAIHYLSEKTNHWQHPLHSKGIVFYFPCLL
jgi:hypothetical protein